VALAAGGAAVTATVTLATRARGEAPLLPPFSKPSPWEWLALAGALLALLAASIMRRFTPRVRRRWLLGALAGACLAVAACGGGNNLPTANNGTPPGTYPMVITATSGTNSQTVTVNVRVY